MQDPVHKKGTQYTHNLCSLIFIHKTNLVKRGDTASSQNQDFSVGVVQLVPTQLLVMTIHLKANQQREWKVPG